jgi:chaperone protein EcpD
MKHNALTNSSPFSLLQRWTRNLGIGIACFCASGLAQADIYIETTRVVYPESRREVSFKIINNAKDKASFVQMWLDDGNPAALPEDVVTPFNLSPPIAQLKPAATQVVRLVYTGEPLPADRESIFYFNMLELPPKSKEENKLSFAVRTRIKVFFRPKALRGDPVSQMDKVTWKLVKQGNSLVAEGNNPTPYHLSFFSVTPGTKDALDKPVDGGMLPPMGKTSVPLGEADQWAGKIPNQLKVEFINDFGGASPMTFEMATAP